MIERCDCDACFDSDNPCSLDCSPDELCPGCQEARAEREEIEFEIDVAQGRR